MWLVTTYQIWRWILHMWNWIILHMWNSMILHMWSWIGWCDKRRRNDQGTRWPGDEMTGDEMTRRRNDRDKMTGDEMKGDESYRVTVIDYLACTFQFSGVKSKIKGSITLAFWMCVSLSNAIFEILTLTISSKTHSTVKRTSKLHIKNANVIDP
jgi:hypothetical protein